MLSGNIGDCVRPERDQSGRRMWVTLYVGAGPDHGPYYVVSVYTVVSERHIWFQGGIKASTHLYPRHYVVLASTLLCIR